MSNFDGRMSAGDRFGMWFSTFAMAFCWTSMESAAIRGEELKFFLSAWGACIFTVSWIVLAIAYPWDES